MSELREWECVNVNNLLRILRVSQEHIIHSIKVKSKSTDYIFPNIQHFKI